LRKKAEAVGLDELAGLTESAQEMARLMYESDGCGLAAPQVGLLKRIIVIDTDWSAPDENGELTNPQEPRFFINPVVKRLWGKKEVADEGCLSVPGITVPVKRFLNIEVEAIDLDGQTVLVEAEGFEARAFQHELDHLEGITMFEHLGPIERISYLQEYDAAIKAGAKPGDTEFPI